ncbi:hypothetical protein [Erythrobacter sp. MTPC3]|uniref:hypothetical protein n=1 Tax=Erythrobacter sp. MTPC3 TaxID=3056564 RepID=UPI0036F30E88
MLFASGKRPAHSAIREFFKGHGRTSISNDPFPDGPLQLAQPGKRDPQATPVDMRTGDNRLSTELLCDGLTFDLHGLAPGAKSAVPDVDHMFDMTERPGALRLEALQLLPGRHIKGAAHTMPVARCMIELARDFVRQFDDLTAVIWEPSSSAIGRRFFESIATAWLDGGAFPAPGLVAFRDTRDGAVQSVGLDFWTGQELRIEEPLSNDTAEAGRLGVRIINRLVPLGGLDTSERMVGLDGNILMLRPSRNGRYVRVTRE